MANTTERIGVSYCSLIAAKQSGCLENNLLMI